MQQRNSRTIIKRSVTGGLGALLLSALPLATKASLAADVQSPKPAARPNILLIVADDLGYSDAQPYGGEIATPNLEQLAREGARIANFHVCPTSSPTRASLLSGTDHHLAGLGTMDGMNTPNQQGKPGYEGYLNERSLSFPELLRDAGYHTYIAGKWHLGLTAPYTPKARGFEESFTLLQGAGFHFNAPQQARSTYLENGEKVNVPESYFSTNYFTDKLISFFDKHKNDGKPFFAFAAYTAPHWPLQAPPELIEKYRGKFDDGYEKIRTARLERMRALGLIATDANIHTALPETQDLPKWDSLTPEQRALEARRMEVFAAMVDNLDQNIGRLIKHLKDTGQYENTAIFFLSDNGAEGHVIPEFRPVGMNNALANIGKADSYAYLGARWAEVGATPFRLSKGFTAEGGVISPAIFRYKGFSLKKGAIDKSFATVRDLAPTFLELAGVEDPGSYYKEHAVHPITGSSLVPYLTGKTKAPHPTNFVFGEELFGNRSIRQGDWKLLWTQPPNGTARWELFNLAHDPGETTDLSVNHPEKLQELLTLWDSYVLQSNVILPEGKNVYLDRHLSLDEGK